MDTFDYFKQICQIPRESHNEEGMRQYLLAWAKENGLEAIRDEAGNIIVKKPATPGFENAPSVALQGHMDMVCVKTPESNHDFTKDPIEVYEDGDFLRAKGTSLGGDNGIAVAMTMAIFTDPTAQHGPLEAIFTFAEETGMDGAFALDASHINSKKLINLDSEEEGVIYIGCAGGIDLVGSLETELDDVPEDWETVEISVGGLKGGHSGAEIDRGRANAISVLARLLMSIDEMGTPFMINAFNGGTRRNVIPSGASCRICFPAKTKKETMTHVLEEFENIKEENRFEDPGLTIEKHCTACGAQKAEKAIGAEISAILAKALFACPHGVFTMSKALPGVVETSDNLAIVKVNDGKLHLEISVRSNIESAKYYLVNRIKTILESFGIDCKVGDGYPSWAPNPDSELAKFCAQAYEQMTGKKAVVTAIHAGLECGVISSKVPGMDSVSIGPNLYDVHSTNEHLSISSSKRMYDYLKKLLSIIC
ncbi:MAG: aminoacyl-histidine dipeptidase [Sphaerochaetaceae bacterium]|nr:aminoacyl-histidine dipeptidase [Sphaerochaetaceae bacterium]